MRFGSLFTGIGGVDLGLERAGMECAWQVEIDDYCTRVLEKHWPNVRRYRDARDCGAHNLEPVDLICGGFPCQPHSVAGKCGGAADDRDLWPEMRRVIAELRPAWVVGENVPGIRDTILDSVLFDLEALGYEALPLGLPACAFGAPIPRQRVFIVAVSKLLGREARYVQRENPSEGSQDQASAWSGGVLHRSSSGRLRRIPDAGVCRVGHGVSSWVDRLRLERVGNAVVPQVAEFIGQCILN